MAEEKKKKGVPIRRRRGFFDIPDWGFRDAFENLLDDFYRFPEKVGIREPKVNVKETNDKITVQAELPGIDEKDVNVELDESSITISGERKEEKEEKKKNWLRREQRYGSFSRTFTLPSEIDPDKAKATYKKGMLNVDLPKKEVSKKKRLDIE